MSHSSVNTLPTNSSRTPNGGTTRNHHPHHLPYSPPRYTTTTTTATIRTATTVTPHRSSIKSHPTPSPTSVHSPPRKVTPTTTTTGTTTTPATTTSTASTTITASIPPDDDDEEEDSNTVGPSIDTATLSYIWNIRTSKTATKMESQKANEVFQTAFDTTWSPSSIVDIKPGDKTTLDLIFYDHQDLDTTTPLHQGMVELQQYISNLVAGWRQEFLESDGIPFGELQHVIEAIEASTWDTYIDYYNTKDHINDKRYTFLEGCALPELKLLKAELEDMLSMNETFRNLLETTMHGQIHTSVDILHSYNCTKTKELEEFQVNDTKLLHKQTKFDMESELLSLNTIYGISSNDPDPSSSRGDWLYLCAYFLEYPSKLFDKFQYQGGKTRDWPNIHTFVKAVNRQRVKIQQLFTVSTMSYQKVAELLRTELTTNDIIETEFKVLMNCKVLSITATDMTHFRIVKLLYDHASALQNFVTICTDHNFHFVHSDLTFPVLQSEVVKFYSDTKQHNGNDCIQFFHRLYDIFCPDGAALKNDIDDDDGNASTESSYMKLLHKLDELTKVLSWLLPLKYVSYGPNIWQYVVVEMKWCGVEGFTKFFETYQKVYNSLKSYSVTNEIFILDNVVPVIQLFSIIGQYKDTCPSVRELLRQFQTNHRDELHNCLNGPSMERSIYDMDSRIVAIRDLLNCGITTATGDARIGHPTNIPMLTVDGVLLPLTERNKEKATQKPPLTCCGTSKEENVMRSWLDTQALPPNVGDLCVSLGIRTMGDVRMFSTLGDAEMNDTFSALPKLDRIKLLNAMKQLTTTSAVSSNKDTDTLDSTKKRKASVAFLSQLFKV